MANVFKTRNNSLYLSAGSTVERTPATIPCADVEPIIRTDFTSFPRPNSNGLEVRAKCVFF